MKKVILLLTVIFLLVSSMTCIFAATDEISVYVEGQKVSFDVPPQTINNRTMVPIRAIFEFMGATVVWDDATQTAICTKDSTTVKMSLNSTTEYINNIPYTMDVAPVIIDNRTLAPARYVAEAFGYSVYWDNATKSVIIGTELSPGDSFSKGDFIIVEDIKITYDDEKFLIENNSDTDIIITCSFYGKKKDDSYEFLGIPAFYGIDETQYEKDKEENGWAIKHRTNRVKSNEKLVMQMEIYDFGDFSWDIDKDGYHDISFNISKQYDENRTTVSTNDLKSGYYRLKAN